MLNSFATRCRSRRLEVAGFLVVAALAAFVAPAARAQTIAGLPKGTDFGLDARERPRQILKSEAEGGRQSYMVALGNAAFSSPTLFGEKAKEAGLSCDSCHRQGDINARFFIPGISAHRGGLDPTNGFFNPVQDDGVANHVDIPSLRGIRFLAPYGRDGRIGSLREFARHVIVNEFAGPEPEPRVLDALVAYMDQIDFLPNSKLNRLGRLASSADPAAKRGEALFVKPFAGMDGKSCANCHVPESLFADGRRHDVGSNGLFKTPTLINAGLTAPYFHDGRYTSFLEVVEHFDRVFSLKLRPEETEDLVAYLDAVSAGEGSYEPVTRQAAMREVSTYVSVLDHAIEANDLAAIGLVVETVNFDLNWIGWRFDTRAEFGGRLPADVPDVRVVSAQLIGDMSAILDLARAGNRVAAKTALANYHARARTIVSNYPVGNLALPSR